tara:strand:+ start:117 stop:878 length:762 start_codon:yes stop_codon:yes gene_type:complete
MAVSVDTVYQRVLTLANKEQRGYITPQEFNLLANQAQMEIFEQYFYDIKNTSTFPGNTAEYSDQLSILQEKIGEFEMEQDQAWMVANMPIAGLVFPANVTMNIPWNLIYKMGTLYHNTTNAGFKRQIEILNTKDFDAAIRSPLTRPTAIRPIACINAVGLRIHDGAGFRTHQDNIGLNISYIIRPPQVQWSYVIVNNKALYNDNTAVDFELHSSEETELVYRILKLSGINLKASEVVQVGQTLEQTQIQQEKK